MDGRIRRCSKVSDLTDLEENWVDIGVGSLQEQHQNQHFHHHQQYHRGLQHHHRTSQDSTSSTDGSTTPTGERKKSFSSTIKKKAVSVLDFLKKGAEQNTLAYDPNIFPFQDSDLW